MCDAMISCSFYWFCSYSYTIVFRKIVFTGPKYLCVFVFELCTLKFWLIFFSGTVSILSELYSLVCKNQWLPKCKFCLWLDNLICHECLLWQITSCLATSIRVSIVRLSLPLSFTVETTATSTAWVSPGPTTSSSCHWCLTTASRELAATGASQ